MADCDLTAGRLEPCKDSIGGIDAIYFINYGETEEITRDESTDEITDLGTAVTAYKYDLKGANGLTQTNQNSRDTGTSVWDQVVSFTLKKQDAATTKEVKIMSYGRPQIVVHYRNGDAVFCGMNRGCEMGGDMVSGQQMTELNGYQLTMTGQEEEPAPPLQGATLADPFAGMTNAPTIVEGV